MSSESRQSPNSNITRRTALVDADSKNTAMGADSFLTTPTKTRLDIIKASYVAAYGAIGPKKFALGSLTNQKYEYAGVSRMINSHFVQVFNFGVDRNVFPKEARAFYNMDINSAIVPDMASDSDLATVGSDLVTGDAKRITAGGTAMAMPTIGEVDDAHKDFNNSLMPHSTAKDALDQAQETLNGLNDEADKVIKKVWDEVETFYNEEDPASQRDNAREWGVKYVRIGSNKKVSGTVRDSVTNLPIEGAKVSFENGNKTVVTGPDGKYELGTTLMGDQAITAESDVHNDYSEIITLVENQDKTWDINMVAAG